LNHVSLSFVQNSGQRQPWFCYTFDTSKKQSAHYPYRIVTLKEIMSKLTILRDRTIAIMWKNVLASGDVKDNLGMMSRQMMDEWQYVKSSQSPIYIHMYILKESQTADQKSELQTFVVWKSGPTKTLLSFVVLKIKNTTFQKSRLQTFVISKTQKADPTKFCSLKGQGYYMSEKRTTNFCSLKKRTLPSFVVSKIKTTCQKSGLQTFVTWKSRHYKLL